VQNIIELEEGASILKLTTAGYHRPSGKNIHRFRDGSSGEAWGVVPDAGFEVKLTADEIRKLATQRRQKDIVRGKSPPPEDAADALGAEIVDQQRQKALQYLCQRLEDVPPKDESTIAARTDDRDDR
jgi:carboxyl-terminal processing protease